MADGSLVDPLPIESPSRRPYAPIFPTFHKAAARTVSFAGQRNLAALAAPIIASYDTVTSYDADVCPGVTGLVALTIDDAPCRQDASACMVKQVAELLSEFDAKATFFVTAEFVRGKDEDMIRLLEDHHEIANHCMYESPCIHLEEEEFEKQLMESEAICEYLRKRACERQGQQDAQAPNPADSKPVQWFRAPGALMNFTMHSVLQRRGFTHVLGDCYANDPWVVEPQFIAETMLENSMDGSVLVIHMPERGFRDYNFPALRLVLEGLRARGLKAVTLSALHKASMRQVTTGSEVSASRVLASLLPDIYEPSEAPQHLHRSSNIFKGTFNAALAITKGAVNGATGLIVKPYEGACEDGVAGFAAGVGQGVAGAVYKPVDGVLEGGTQILGGVAGTFYGMPRAVYRSIG